MPRRPNEVNPLPLPASAPKRLLVTSPKGGAGKTGTARNLAVAAVLDGLRVVTLDFDRQRSLSVWWSRRPDGLAPIEHIEGDLDAAAQVSGLAGNADLLVIDTPTSVEEYPEAIRTLIGLADLVLVPCQASPDDTDSVIPWMRFVAGLTPRYAAVLNRVNRRAASFQRARQRLIAVGNVCPIEVPQYEDIIAAGEAGAGIMEVRGARGADDMRALWAFVRREIGL